MTNEKVKQVAKRYATHIRENAEKRLRGRLTVAAERGPVELPWNHWAALERINHLLYVCQEIPQLLDAGRVEKAMRWLGWLQGILVAEGEYTIDECGNHSRPDANEEDGPCICGSPTRKE